MSRTVNGERVFDDVAKEILRKQLWQVADFCGVHIITYVVLSNHFHVLVRVPQQRSVSDAELLRRYAVLYPKPTRFQSARLDVVRQQLATDGEEAVRWRQRQLALMGDVSPFMKLLKQRFSVWFNRSRQRYGTLWAERFKSVLVEPRHHAMRTVAAYIDLNAVRAGLATDPKDYRFCGYAEALAGNPSARRGLSSVVESADWMQAQAAYRETLFGTVAGVREHGAVLSDEQFRQVVAQKGRLPLASVLRHRVRYFSDGAVLGGKVFVEMHLHVYRARGGGRSRSGAKALPAITDWGGLVTMRGLRTQALGGAGH